HEDEGHRSRFSLDERERLCPYCAVKRAARRVAAATLRELGMHAEENPRKMVPSTPELAMAGVLRKLELEGGPEIAEWLEGCADGYEEACGAIRGWVEERGIKWEDFLKTLRELGSKYYAVIKGDGDWLGRTWSGYPGDGAAPHPQGLRSYAEQIGVQSQSLRELEESYGAIFGEAGELGTPIPVTPAYAYAVSRALSAQAVSDAASLERLGALVIYAGGDDLLALAPLRLEEVHGYVYVPLEAVGVTRASYWGDRLDGFIVLGKGAVADSLRGYGRSYAIFVAHYKDPLPLAIRRAAELLEMKDRVEGKDALLVSSGRGLGEPEVAVLRLGSQSAIAAVKELLDAINSGQLSSNTIYDLMQLEDYSGQALGDPAFAGVYRLMARNTLRRNCRARDEECERKVGNLTDAATERPCAGSPCSRDLLLMVALAASHLR
ncbi:MAG: hypothetical protein ACP5ID_06500, partial [Conexivisphaera sp.]